MKCPSCNGIDLLISERQGIEIDYCPKCRGVWLDRGELDKFIERSERQFPAKSETIAYAIGGSEASVPQFSSKQDMDNASSDDRYRRDYDDDKSRHARHGKKKESFWGELFDFG